MPITSDSETSAVLSHSLLFVGTPALPSLKGQKLNLLGKVIRGRKTPVTVDEDATCSARLLTCPRILIH